MNWEKIKNNKWVQKVLKLFKQGLTPKELALSISAGAVIGIIPMFGVTTILITFLAVYLRLNLPLSLFVTYAMGPIHLLMFIPFIRIGEYLLGAEHTLLTFVAIREAFKADYLLAIRDLSLEVVCGLTGWTIAGVPSAIVLFFILWTGISFFMRKS